MAEALDAALRKSRRARKAPQGVRCGTCGIRNPAVLHRDGAAWHCYECATVQHGNGPTEAHHILGKAIHPMTVDVPANLHRILSEEQLNIPEKLRSRSPHNPLVWIIRLLCAIRDFGKAIVDLLSTCVQWLTRLLTALEARFGEHWTDALGLPPLFE